MSRQWMPLYVADYWKDTTHLSTFEHGAYLLLIMHYWAKGGLPANDMQLQRICRASASEWEVLKIVLSEFFDVENGWRHSRIDAELEKSSMISTKRKNAAEKRHANAPANAYANAPANAEQMHTQSQSHISSSSGADPLAQKCRALVGQEPVLLATDFHSISVLVEDGTVTEEDVLAGIRAAMATPSFRIRNWSSLVNWVRRAAKDRMAGGKKQVVVPISTPPPEPKFTDENWKYLLERYRDLGEWPVRGCGPSPDQPGCKVPKHLLEVA
jgi:uncharacterized protein YdaU (DUF1376 family)